MKVGKKPGERGKAGRNQEIGENPGDRREPGSIKSLGRLEMFRWVRKKLTGSFTVEASLVVPLFVIIIVIGLHIGMDWNQTVMVQTEKEPVVKTLEPVAEMYKK